MSEREPTAKQLAHAKKLILRIWPMLDGEKDTDTVSVVLVSLLMMYLVRTCDEGNEEHPMDIMDRLGDLALHSMVAYMKEAHQQ